MSAANLGQHLIFLICPQRSGSTMLQRMLQSHSRIQGLPEPHVLPPLRFLGYYAQPDKADYDIVNCGLAIREFVGNLPGGEADYLDALRAYVLHLYDRARAIGGPRMRYFLDKTPMNALHWRFVVKLFPEARYIVLTRNPVAVLDSMARTFYDGDYATLLAEDATTAAYMEQIALLLSERPVDLLHVTYEQLVADPHAQASRIMAYLGLEMEAAVVEYGRSTHVSGSMGDPVTVDRRDRPDPALAERWAAELAADGAKREAAARFVANLPREQVEALGYRKEQLLEPVREADPTIAAALKTREPRGYRTRRRVYFMVRRWTAWPPFRRLLERTRYYCDVLLRD